MARLRSAIGFLSVVIVASANVETIWAQSEELPRSLRERISRRLVGGSLPSAAAAFDTEVKITLPAGGSRRPVAISGDTAIVGVPPGAAFVFRRDEGGLDNWGEVTEITVSDRATGAVFGWLVAISGDTAIVSALIDSNTESGSAYVFQRNEGGPDNWGEVARVTARAGAAGDRFGNSVGISGDTAIVGSFSDNDNGFRSGSAYVYRQNAGGKDNWGEVAKINASDGVTQDHFGNSVAISGETAIVGAPSDGDNGEHSGSAYVFQRNVGGVDNWGEVAKISASDGAAEDRFGTSVAISGDVLIVGAHFDGDNGDYSGSAYIYQRDEGGKDNWSEVTKITASDGAAEDAFGNPVAISGDTVIVGAYFDDGKETNSGSAYVYRRDEGGKDNWGEVTKITASDGGGFQEFFGQSVDISGDTAIVGTRSAAAYVYFEIQVCVDDAECADGDACNGAETCNTETSRCVPGTPIQCDDGDGCDGIESCDPKTGDCIDGAINDCDANGIDDACDLADCGGDPGCDDCDGNGSLDRCDITSGQPDVNGNGQLDQCEPPCIDNASCDDSELCSFDRCIDNLCWYDVDARYGDVAGEAGVCGPDGDVGLTDIIAVLDAFAGQFAEGCELVNIDIASQPDACVGDATIDLLDILAVLDAFQGTATCCLGRR